MKSKTLKLVSIFLVSLFGSVLVFTMSSKSTNISPNQSCLDDISGAGNEAFVQILFDPAADLSGYRKPAYVGYVPSDDIRYGAIPVASTLGTPTYGAHTLRVTVSSPSCTEWNVSFMGSSDNFTSDGKLKIPMVPPGYDIKLEITYTETADGYLARPDFNQNKPSGTSTSALRWRFSQVFFSGWEDNIPQPIMLTPVGLIDASDDGTSSSKKKEIADYKDVNHYLEVNSLLGN